MKSRMIPVLCILLLFLTACQKQTSDDPIVASYKDTQIHESLVAYEKQNQINVTGDKTVSDADALDQLLFGNVDVDHDVDLKTVSGEDFVELLGLNRGAGKAVENTAGGVHVPGDIVVDHADYDLIGSQLPGLDVGFHALSQFRTPANLVTDHLARGNVIDSVVFLQALCLRAFAATRSAE